MSPPIGARTVVFDCCERKRVTEAFLQFENDFQAKPLCSVPLVDFRLSLDQLHRALCTTIRLRSEG